MLICLRLGEGVKQFVESPFPFGNSWVHGSFCIEIEHCNIVITSMLGRWPPAIPYQVDSIPFVYSEIYVPSISKLLAHAARSIWVLHFEVRFQPQRNPIITILYTSIAARGGGGSFKSRVISGTPTNGTLLW